MKHPTSFELQEYLDHLTDKTKRIEVETHIRFCNDCDTALKLLRKVDSALANIPVKKTSRDFTDAVMKQLGVKTSQSFGWTILKNLAPLFALLVIVSVIYGTMNLAGTLDSSGLGGSIKMTQKVYDTVGSGLANTTTKFNEVIKNVFGFLYVKGVSGLTTFLVLFLCAIGILDKYVFMPLIKKRL